MAYTPTRSNIRSAEELAALYGIDYNESNIKSKLDMATKGQYDVQRQQYKNTENDYYSQLMANQTLTLDALRKNKGAVISGASRGVQAAQELSAIMGSQQMGVQGATQLAQQKNLLNDQEGAAYMKNAVDAMNTSNTLKGQLGSLSSQLYSTDTQFDVGQMEYYAQLDAAMKQLQAAQAAASAQRAAAATAANAQVKAAQIANGGQLTFQQQQQMQRDKYMYDKDIALIPYTEYYAQQMGIDPSSPSAYKPGPNAMTSGNRNGVVTGYMTQAQQKAQDQALAEFKKKYNIK